MRIAKIALTIAAIVGGLLLSPGAHAEVGPLENTLNIGSTINKRVEWYTYAMPGEKVVARFKVVYVWKPTAEHKGVFELYDPDGRLVQSVEMNGVSHGRVGDVVELASPHASSAGAYKIVYRLVNAPGAGTLATDWTIGATKNSYDDITLGRVWVNDSYFLVHRNEARLTDIKVWYVGDHGLKYAVTYGGYMGVYSTIAANNMGRLDKDCMPSYVSGLNEGNRSCKNKKLLYKIFFAEPDGVLPESVALPGGKSTWLNPSVKPTTIEQMKFTSDGDATRPVKGVVSAIVKNYAGTMKLLVDVNNDGDAADAEDRVIPLYSEHEVLQYHFDGLDGAGAIIPEGVKVGFRLVADKKGEIHFQRADVELNTKGISVRRLNGSTVLPTRLYWNDEGLKPTCGTQNIAPLNNAVRGVDSDAGVHGWTGDGCVTPSGRPSNGNSYWSYTPAQRLAASAWGDERWIDDWTFDPGMTVSSDVFYNAMPTSPAQPQTPPVPKPNPVVPQPVAPQQIETGLAATGEGVWQIGMMSLLGVIGGVALHRRAR